MGRFQDTASDLFEIAQKVSGERNEGEDPADVAVLIHYTGALTIVQNAGERSLGALQDEYGAHTGYRVLEAKDGAISITGRVGGQTYTLTPGIDERHRQLMGSEFPRYLLK
ncbi:hypothetical protein F183_A44130 [Bryobacterales bacterium F-183]|nr:hypothetical protein F183_A44130 [Bryobacterales bacterium F-183]